MHTQPMELASLLAGICFVDPEWDRKISAICLDSREVVPGALFIAYIGQTIDARTRIPEAIANGASAIIAEANPPFELTIPADIPVFFVDNLSQQIGKIASRFYDHPSRHLTMIGITGTNGKTSCSYYTAQILAHLKQRCGVIGTLGYGVYNETMQAASHTTPDQIRLQALLADFKAQDVKTVAMEVSSHALEQNRAKNIEFNVAIFTNLTRDHLDYHSSMQAYGEAKAKLFEYFNLQYAVLNADDDFNDTLKQKVSVTAKTLSYSCKKNDADVYASDIQLSPKGIRATIHTPWGEAELTTTLLGIFNLSNVLAVVTSLAALGYPLSDLLAAANQLTPVAGRMQALQQAASPLVVIDYAHTPDALSQALSTLKSHCQGKLWCVFGCGGGRDVGKRADMGQAASQFADKIIVTSDNPRFEEPMAIIEGILNGIPGRQTTTVEADRSLAIKKALAAAAAEDIVLIAGKGHETYQEIAGERLPFSDLEQVQQFLAKVG